MSLSRAPLTEREGKGGSAGGREGGFLDFWGLIGFLKGFVACFGKGTTVDQQYGLRVKLYRVLWVW